MGLAGFFGIDQIAPATVHAVITKSDGNKQPVFRTIYCTGAGDAVIQDAAGNTITYAMAVGDTLAFSPTFVMNATTATLVGWK